MSHLTVDDAILIVVILRERFICMETQILTTGEGDDRYKTNKKLQNIFYII